MGVVMSLTCLLLLSLLLLYVAAASSSTVFLEHKHAVRLLRMRKPRANYFLEEMKPGNLERECYEETCSQEEAAEIFQSKEKTMEFWYRYKNLNHCRYNPCLNNGICTMDRHEYICLCPPQYGGKHCETEVFECEYRNGGCHQYCRQTVQGAAVECSCANGYQLEPDGKSCHETVRYPCGKQWSQNSMVRSFQGDDFLLNDTDPNLSHILNDSYPHTLNYTHNYTHTQPLNYTHNYTDPERDKQENSTFIWRNWANGSYSEPEMNHRIVGGQLQPQGGSPWQVLLRRKDEYGFCGGSLITDRWVITAAHCLQEMPDHVTVGDYDKMREDPHEQRIGVEKVVTHPHFHDYTFDSDIALLYLAEPVELGPYATPICLPNTQLAKQLLREGTHGLVTGWGATHYLRRSSRFLRKVVLPVVDQQKCMASTEQVITDNMFCAGYLQAPRDACRGDSGGPFAVNYRGTWFLTGVVSWGERCAAVGKYGVYTRLGNYLHWIRDEIHKQARNNNQT
ncbi:coagulation factor IX [Chanos chanos]|uniref:Coagulation factor IX n=1 Tax=Chanos chanos TaxID=29144 RepID=A0A6J2VGE7_CHACN|nr:coagulation factor IX-like [Chanos chanos]